MSQKHTVASVHEEVATLTQAVDNFSKSVGNALQDHDKRLDKLENDFAKLDKNIAVEFAIIKEKQDSNTKLLTEIRSQQADNLKEISLNLKEKAREPQEENTWFKRLVIQIAVTSVLAGFMGAVMTLILK